MGRIHKFEERLRQGAVGEAQLDLYFSSSFRIVEASMNMQLCGIDRIFIAKHGIQFTVEYKTDFMASATGNAYIEYISVMRGKKIEKYGWLHTSLAQVLVYYLPEEGKAYWLYMLDLKKAFSKWRLEHRSADAENEDYNSRGLLLPLELLQQKAQQEFNGLPVIKAKK